MFISKVTAMNTRESIERLLAEQNNMINLATKELNRSPRGRLSICNQKDGIRFLKESIKDGKRVRKGIGKDAATLYRLAHKAYLQEFILRSKQNESVLAECLEHMHSVDPGEILKSLPDNYSLLNAAYIVDPNLLAEKPLYPHPSRDVEPARLQTTTGTLSPLEWACLPYCENTTFPEHKIHLTSKGLLARSKSEVSLLELYEQKSLLYHYDETVIFNGDWLSPDFIFARPDGRLVIHEHMGWDGDRYVDRNRRKLRIYESAGFRQGVNLILTFDNESGGIDLRLADALIDNMLGI